MTGYLWFRLKCAGVGALLVVGATCSLAINRDSAQCHADSDCTQFGYHPHCDLATQVCVRSGLAPKDCFAGSPMKPADFPNGCSKNFLPDPVGGECLTFDNCRAGQCNLASTDADGASRLPPVTPPNPTPAGDAGTDGKVSLPLCHDPANGRASVVYITGSSNFPPLLTNLAPIIHGLNGQTPIFLTTDSCTGARSMFPMNALTDHLIHDPAPGTTGAYAQYFDDTGGHDCTLGSGPVPVDIGESEIDAETCDIAPDPVNVAEFPGPILPILIVVPGMSIEKAISAEAARQVFGNGGVLPNGQKIAPWDDPHFFFIRGAGTATTRLVGIAVGVPAPYKFWGSDQGSALNLAVNLGFVVNKDDAEKSIGILGADYFDQNRDRLKTLAFKGRGQTCAYTPDSNSNLSAGIKDKINVRDGHYPIWGTLHFYAKRVNAGLDDAAAQTFVTQFDVPPISEALIDAFIDASWVPDCAMKVQRDTELGDLSPNLPRFPCNCHFDARVSKSPPPGCTRCDADTPCMDPTKQCSFHYCEPLPPT